MRLSAGEHIDAAPSDVFRFVATEHFANHPRWDPSIIDMTQTSVGPMGPGSTARVVRIQGGRRIEGTVTVTVYRPQTHFAATVDHGSFQLRQEVHCSPRTTGGTDLVLVIDSRASGALRLVLPLMRARFTRTMRASLRSIRERIEERPPG
ncbi:SRPBCC family protein [Blastococcus sp. SYSU DS0669]